MKFLKYLVFLAIFAGVASTYAADPDIAAGHPGRQDGSRFSIDLNERDWLALREFVNTKRDIDIKKKADHLVISGEVRTEWRHLMEKFAGFELRGPKKVNPYNGQPISRNDFDIEFDLRMDYTYERAWAVAHLQFDNSAGVDGNGIACPIDPQGYHGSATSSNINLKRAFMGYNIYKDGICRFDVEVGRRKLYDAFDSEIQFDSRFDGILLKYSCSWECVADWYVHAAAFIVDEKVNHFSYVSEIGFLNIMDTGLDLKYSFIHWNKYGINRCFARNPQGFHSQNSQFTFEYHFNPEWLNRPASIFGAVLYNHDADHHTTIYSQVVRDESSPSDWDVILIPKGKRIKSYGPWGWYLGFVLGEVDKEGDWSFEVQYQVVQATAMPDDDVSGIGRGNVWSESFTSDGRGNTNYKGWKFEALYALTDNLTLDSIIEFSRAYKKSIGGSHSYSKFELEAIYAF